MVNWTARKVALCIFYGWVFVSIFYLVFPTLNYLEFFVAVRNLSFIVKSFECKVLNQSGEEKVLILGKFSLFQNSSYVGLRVFRVHVKIFYENMFSPIVSSYFLIDDEIGPFSEKEFSLNVTVSDKLLINNLVALCDGSGSLVRWTIHSSTYIYVFGELSTTLLPLNSITFEKFVPVQTE